MIIQMGIQIGAQIFSVGRQKKMIGSDRCCHDVAGRRREPLRRVRFFVVIHEKFDLKWLDLVEFKLRHYITKIIQKRKFFLYHIGQGQKQIDVKGNVRQIVMHKSVKEKDPQSHCQLALCLAGKWVKSWVIVAFFSLWFETLETYACLCSSLARRPSCSPTRTKVSMELSELCRRSSSQVTIPALKTNTQVLPPYAKYPEDGQRYDREASHSTLTEFVSFSNRLTRLDSEVYWPDE